MYKLFVITYAGNGTPSTQVIAYERAENADKAAELLRAAAGKTFNVTVVKLYE
jgi:hypothetical protein